MNSLNILLLYLKSNNPLIDIKYTFNFYMLYPYSKPEQGRKKRVKKNLKLMLNYLLRLKNVGHKPIFNVFDKSQ